MVSIKLQGGLANQMFMIAFLVAYAEKHDLEYCIPHHVINPHIPGRPAYYFEGLNYGNDMPEHITLEHSFEHHNYPKIDDTTFVGYFQSEKYFNEKTYSLFNLPWKNNTGVCGVHVRRGDYVRQYEYHPPVEEKYIVTAMRQIWDKTGIVNFKFYSDDIDWCKEKFYNHSLNWNIGFSEGINELDELAALSSHQFIIGSNSAFSLWAYYLNKNLNKKIILPNTWFGPKLPHSTKDLYPEGAIML